MQDSRYKVVLRTDGGTTGNDALRWSPGCPIQLAAIQVSRDTTTGEAFLQLKLKNVSAEVVSSFELVATCGFEDGTAEQVAVNPLDADIAPGTDYTPQAVRLSKGNVASVAAEVLKARFGLETWSPTSDDDVIPEPAPLELSKDEAQERKLLLLELDVSPEYAIPMSTRGIVKHDGWTLCACGQVNVGRDACCRCGMPFESAEELQEASYLDKKAAERAASEADRLERERHAAEEKKAKAAEEKKAKAAAVKKRVAIVCAIIALVGAAVGVSKYVAAEKAYDAGDYEDAASRYENLGMSGRANEAKYQYVKQNYNNEDLTTKAYLDELVAADYSDASELADALYAWNVEFTVCSHKDWEKSGEEWCTSTQYSAIGDYALLLARVTGSKPGETKTYKLSAELKLSRGGDWEKYYFTKSYDTADILVKGDGEADCVFSTFIMDGVAWRFTVTDSETSEIVYTGELHAE